MRIFFVLAALAVVLNLTAQKNKNQEDIDYKQFFKDQDLAEYFIHYDYVAWISSDSLMKNDSAEIAKLGSSWFCYLDSLDRWHALYGAFSEDAFVQVFHYLYDYQNPVTRVRQIVDTTFANPYARALELAKNKLYTYVNNSTISFNPYIKRLENGQLLVTYFPAWQSNGKLIYGVEFVFFISEDGKSILEENHYFKNSYFSVVPNKETEISINYLDCVQPTLGSIFFVQYYTKYFKTLSVENKNTVSTFMKIDSNEGGNTWVTMEKSKKRLKQDKKWLKKEGIK